MSRIEIRKIGVTKLYVDAVVNAANSHLQAGSGVCGAIFKEAGYAKLQAACDKIGHCDPGSAVITPGFGLKAKYIIHAVGPIWNDGDHGEPQQLYGCYREALKLAVKNDCHSIAFPLISAGIFGYPKDKAWRKALQACHDFLKQNPGVKIDIFFAVLDDTILKLGEKTLQELGISGPEATYDRQKEYCKKYIPLLQTIEWDDELSQWCRDFNPYESARAHKGLERMLNAVMMPEAYDYDVPIHNYGEVIQKGGLDNDMIADPSDGFIAALSDEQLLACITWHFRADHFDNGSLIRHSIAGGQLLKYMKAFAERT